MSSPSSPPSSSSSTIIKKFFKNIFTLIQTFFFILSIIQVCILNTPDKTFILKAFEAGMLDELAQAMHFAVMAKSAPKGPLM